MSNLQRQFRLLLVLPSLVEGLPVLKGHDGRAASQPSYHDCEQQKGSKGQR